MRSFTIFLALFVFSLTTTAISDMSVIDDAGVEHSVYAGEPLPNQGLNISQEQMEQMGATGTETESPSMTDVLSMANFALFTLLPLLLKSMKEAFYVVGWLGAWGVPAVMAWGLQGSLWFLYGRDLFQILSNRSLKSFE